MLAHRYWDMLLAGQCPCHLLSASTRQAEILAGRDLAQGLHPVETAMVLAQHSFYCHNVVAGLGGTIDMTGKTSRKIPAAGLQARRSINPYNHPHRISVFARPIDSAKLLTSQRIVRVFEVVHGIERWRGEIRRELEAQPHGPLEKGGMLLSMGSDTAGLLALALDLEMVRSALDVRVSLTVAHSPADIPGSDALENEYHASITAANSTLPPGVYAVIGRHVHSGADLVKIRTSPTAGQGYFVSYGTTLGRFEDPPQPGNFGDQVTWNMESLAAKREAWARGRIVLSEWQDFQDRPKNMGYVETMIANRETPIELF